MNKEIFISESMGESRIAIIEDGTLVEVYIEKQDHQRMVGNIYNGIVENVLPGMQAAFVDIGYDINAFLPFSEIENPALLSDYDEGGDEKEKKRKKKDKSCLTIYFKILNILLEKWVMEMLLSTKR